MTAEAVLTETTESNFCNLKFNILTISPFQFANALKGTDLLIENNYPHHGKMWIIKNKY
jgi:hypothetical protein